MKTLAFAMVLAVALITLVANLGYAGRVFSFLRHVPGGDASGHFGLFGLLALAVVSSVSRASPPATRSTRVRVTAVLALLVTIEEFSQALIPTRTFSLQDLSASLGGILVGSLAAIWLFRQ